MTEDDFLGEVIRNPHDATLYLILADWLEENDDPRRAELLRLRCRLQESWCDPDDHPERKEWQGRIVQLLSEGVRPSVPRKVIQGGLGQEIVMHFISPGTFLMGSPPSEEGHENDEGPVHGVEITRPFYMGIYPVTVAQFRSFISETDNAIHNDLWFRSFWKLHDQDPVTCVSWGDTRAFCDWLSNRSNANQGGFTFRLPTEAEWEFACRGGASSYQAFHFGNSLGSDQANFDGNYPHGDGPRGPYLQRTRSVGSYPPNAFGLYDLHGNVWEWCEDWYDQNYYLNSPRMDPACQEGWVTRVQRGGGWSSDGNNCRSAFRGMGAADRRYQDLRLPGCGSSPAGSGLMNSFGLHDMHGNVWEWCADGYGKNYYANGHRKDPSGQTETPARVLRGGSWAEPSLGMQVSYSVHPFAG